MKFVTLGSEEWPVVQSDYGALFSFVYKQLLNIFLTTKFKYSLSKALNLRKLAHCTKKTRKKIGCNKSVG